MYRDGRLLRLPKKKARGLLPSRAVGNDCRRRPHSALVEVRSWLVTHLRSFTSSVANRSAQFAVGRSITGKATLGQPGDTEIEEACRLLRRERVRSDRRRMMRRRTAR